MPEAPLERRPGRGAPGGGSRGAHHRGRRRRRGRRRHDGCRHRRGRGEGGPPGPAVRRPARSEPPRRHGTRPAPGAGRRPRPARRRAGAGRPRPGQRGRFRRRPGRLRARRRGGPGGPRRQARAAARGRDGGRPGRGARGRARHQHLLVVGDGRRGRARAAGAARRPALLQPGPADGPGRGRPRRRDRPQGRRGGDRAGPGLGQDPRAVRLHPRLRGEPRGASVLRRGPAARGARCRDPGHDRRRAAGGRGLPDGAVPAHRPGRPGRESRRVDVGVGADVPRPSIRADPVPAQARRCRPAGAQDGPRRLRVLRRGAGDRRGARQLSPPAGAGRRRAGRVRHGPR